MEPNQQDFFIACYFADYERLKTFDITEELKLFRFTFGSTSGYNIHAGTPDLYLTAEDVLMMSYDAWYDVRDWTELNSEEDINPSVVFANIVLCLEWLGVDIATYEVDYFKHYFVEHSICDDEDWFSAEECAEFRAQGSRQIDLDLYNAAMKYNRALIKELLRMGADGHADPYQEGLYGSCLGSFALDSSSGFIELVSCYGIHMHGRAIVPDDFTHMVRVLFCCAASDEMTRVISG